jgi:hypothetical protein
MRVFAVVGLCAVGLIGCASTADSNRIAQTQCASVGITPRDPDFATCMQAYRQLRREDSLETNYRNAINAVPDDRRMGHNWVY